jgi:hypothetical protein
MKFLALIGLAGIFLTIPMVGGALFALFAAGLFFLALAGVVGGLEDRTVRQRGGVSDPEGWRNGS